MVKGGRRIGAGRPLIAPEKKRVPFCMSVSPETKQWMRDMATQQGLTAGGVLELLIASYENFCENSD